MTHLIKRRNLLSGFVALIAASLGRLGSVVGADLKVRLRNPRFHLRKRRAARYSGAPGWYWNVKRLPPRRVAHYVRPRYWFHHTKSDPKKRGRTIIFDAGRVKGHGAFAPKRLVPFQPMDFDKFDEPRDRLKVSGYSQGIEDFALDAWKRNDRSAAIAALKVGALYVDKTDTLNVRLLDLLAGLLVRAGREDEMPQLLTILVKEIDKVDLDIWESDPNSTTDDPASNRRGRKMRLRADSARRRYRKLQTYRAALARRRDKWVSPGPWRDSWTQNSAHRWNGISI